MTKYRVIRVIETEAESPDAAVEQMLSAMFTPEVGTMLHVRDINAGDQFQCVLEQSDVDSILAAIDAPAPAPTCPGVAELEEIQAASSGQRLVPAAYADYAAGTFQAWIDSGDIHSEDALERARRVIAALRWSPAPATTLEALLAACEEAGATVKFGVGWVGVKPRDYCEQCRKGPWLAALAEAMRAAGVPVPGEESAP